MVSIMSWILLAAQVAQAAPSQYLKFKWQGSKKPVCQHLIEIFFTELRSMAADRIIELETTDSSTAPLSLTCSEKASSTVDVSDGQQILSLHYMAKAGGFDAADWVPFQERYLRLSPINLAPEAHSPEPLGMTMANAEPQGAQKKIPAIFQRWWFWTLLGTVGAGTYFLVNHSGGSSSSVNVEIH